MSLGRENNVLIIGYGCAGRIHEKIWRQKGYNIFYTDIDWVKIRHKKNTYKNLKDFFSVNKNKKEKFIYDICCNTENHLTVLKTIGHCHERANVIIEKPVVHSLSELKEFLAFVKRHKDTKIFINENYFFSKTLELVKKKISRYNIDPHEIYIEFSKDRKKDLANGRFVDRKLGVFGIEFPHMLTIIDYLGFGDKIKACKAHYKRGAITLASYSGKTVISLHSSLEGDFFYKTEVNPNVFRNQRFRVVDIKSRTYRITIFWEPLRGKKRLWNRIIIKKRGKIIKDFYVYDNTMLNSLSYAERYFRNKNNDYNPLLHKCYKIVIALNKFLKHVS